MPRSRAAGSASLTKTGKPAFASTMAIPPPMVPAPMTPVDLTGISGVSFGMSGILATSRSAKKMCMSALACGERRHSENNFCSILQPSANGILVGFHSLNRRQRRHHATLFLATVFARGGKNAGILLRRAELVVPFPCFWGRLPFDLLSKGNRTGQKVAVDELIEDAQLQGFFGGDRIAFSTHLDGLRDAR